MALTMSEERYQEIRRKVMKQRLATKVEKIVSEPGARTFGSVDEFFEFLDALVPPKDTAPESRRKRR